MKRVEDKRRSGVKERIRWGNTGCRGGKLGRKDEECGRNKGKEGGGERKRRRRR